MTSSPLSATEFAVLRETISRRGMARMVLVPVTFFSWAALVVALLLPGRTPVATLFTLAVLAAGFEAIHALHVGTERIGRYLQVRYENEPDGPRWETTAMAVGPALPGGGIDPLFSVLFALATFGNMWLALVPEPTPVELGVTGVFHATFLFRVVKSRWAATRQRAVELESFRALLTRPPDRS